MSTATTVDKFQLHQMSLAQLAAMHPRQQESGDLIPDGVDQFDTPEVYRDLHETLEEFFLDQASQS
jgi:hypothetical protein